MRQCPPSYQGPRLEVVGFLRDVDGPVLDVGCSTGSLGRALKQRFGASLVVWGIEIDATAAHEAATHLDRVLVGDAADTLASLKREDFHPQLIIFADSLEHMVDPWEVFDHGLNLLSPGGRILVSLPNVAYWETVLNLLRGRWPYRERGIHDQTHLRFFARKNVIDLLNRGSAHIVKVKRLYRLIEHPHWINRIASVFGWILPELFTYQFLGLSIVEVDDDSEG